VSALGENIPSDRDDRRQAASIVTSLSSSVTSASVALLGAAAIITTYVADKYEHLLPFYIVMGVATLALVWSLLQGGEGIYEIAKTGFDGNWTIHSERRRFNKQVAWMLGGVALLVASSVLGLTARRRENVPGKVTVIVKGVPGPPGPRGLRGPTGPPGSCPTGSNAPDIC
jgi:hypothetical protein